MIKICIHEYLQSYIYDEILLLHLRNIISSHNIFFQKKALQTSV